MYRIAILVFPVTEGNGMGEALSYLIVLFQKACSLEPLFLLCDCFVFVFVLPLSSLYHSHPLLVVPTVASVHYRELTFLSSPVPWITG